jgi:hypothetical protein
LRTRFFPVSNAVERGVAIAEVLLDRDARVGRGLIGEAGLTGVGEKDLDQRIAADLAQRVESGHDEASLKALRFRQLKLPLSPSSVPGGILNNGVDLIAEAGSLAPARPYSIIIAASHGQRDPDHRGR